jgi:hypothetical protein
MLMFMEPMTARMYHSRARRKQGPRLAQPAPATASRTSSLGYDRNAMSGPGSAFRQHARLLWRLSLALALIALTALALSGRLGAVQGGVLIMLPALLLAVVMYTRPYLGEQAIVRLRRGRRKRRLGTTACALAPPRSPARASRGGRLIAVALAGRAPPLALAGCR